jgi:AraC family transcriptional regulator
MTPPSIRTIEQLRATRFAEHSVELPGINITMNVSHPKGFIDVSHCEKDHILTLYMMPLPNVRNCYIPSDKAKTPIEVGALSLRPAGVPWRIITVGLPVRSLIVSISPQKYYEVTGRKDHAWDLEAATNILGTPINVTMLRIALELNKPGLKSRRLIELLAESLVIDLARFADDKTSGSAASRGGLSSEQIRAIKEYLEKSDGRGMTIPKISKFLKLSSRHLTRMFKISTGSTIHAYIAEVRMRQAVALLSTSDLPLKEIAYKVGYSASSSFSAAFRDMTGISPRAFRKDIQSRTPNS